jgi:hypothetical protein
MTVARTPLAPLIMTAYGAVTESARQQAAANMAADHAKRAAVIQLLADQIFDGDLAKGEAEARKRYPEAGWEVS